MKEVRVGAVLHVSEFVPNIWCLKAWMQILHVCFWLWGTKQIWSWWPQRSQWLQQNIRCILDPNGLVFWPRSWTGVSIPLRLCEKSRSCWEISSLILVILFQTVAGCLCLCLDFFCFDCSSQSPSRFQAVSELFSLTDQRCELIFPLSKHYFSFVFVELKKKTSNRRVIKLLQQNNHPRRILQITDGHFTWLLFDFIMLSCLVC